MKLIFFYFSLSKEARERKEQREKTRQQQSNPFMSQMTNSITPQALLESTKISSQFDVHLKPDNQSIDIVQLLNKAQLDYPATSSSNTAQLALSPTSHSTPATTGLISSTSEAPKQLLSQLLFINSTRGAPSTSLSSKPSVQLPSESSASSSNILMMLNASSSLSSTSSPTSSTTSSSVNESTKKQSMNPLVQMLFDNNTISTNANFNKQTIFPKSDER